MSKFLRYAQLIAKRTFSSADAIAKAGGVIALFVAGFTFPALTWRLAIGLGVLLTFYSSFMVWRDQLEEAEKAKGKLAALRNKIPEFTIMIGVVKKYSVSNLIAEYESQINLISFPPSPPPISSTATSTMTRAIASLVQTQATALRAYGVESAQEKVTRLKDHVALLRELEDLLECTYYVEMNIKGTRSDDNIQVQLKADRPVIFIKEDHFINRILPHTKAPSGGIDFSTPTFLSNTIEDFRWPNIKKPRDSIHLGSEDWMATKIDHMNADYTRSVFNEDLWVQFEGDEIELEIAIHSKLRNSAQKIKKTISVYGLQPIQVSE